MTFSRQSSRQLRLPPTLSTEPVQPSPCDRAFVKGVLDAVYGAFGALATEDNSKSKLYHRYPLGSDEELEWQKACQFAAEKMMEGAVTQQELRRK